MPFQCTSNAPNAKLKFWLNIFRVAKKKKKKGTLLWSKVTCRSMGRF